jgi:hypothetical protein
MNDNKLIKTGSFAFYGYSYHKLPEKIEENKNNIIKIYYLKVKQKKGYEGKVNFDHYNGSKDTPWDTRDYVFLDQSAVKALCIGYPTKSKYIFVSLKYPKYYIYILIGLIRRLKHGSIKINSVRKFSDVSIFGLWLELQCKDIETNSYKFSREIGIKGFLEFLKNRNISYIIPRFFESLPELTDENNDLDLIVTKSHSEIVKDFIRKNPGDLQIDLYTDTGPDYHGITYVPPSKIKDIIKRAKIGPGGAKIPEDLDYLNLLIYHVLYHKGYLSGIQSNFRVIDVDQNNKYLRLIRNLKERTNVEFEDTLESMDDYMERKGWRPAIDTLAKIANWNQWVSDKITYKSSSNLFPLYLMVLKNLLKESDDKLNKIKKILKEEEVIIVEERELFNEALENAINKTRGGIWNDSLNYDDIETDYHPYKVWVLYDRLTKDKNHFINIKQKIRKIIDNGKTSLIHTTDNYDETKEYIKEIMVDKIEYYNNISLIKLKYDNYKIINHKKILVIMNSLIPKIKIKTRQILKSIFEH